MANTPQVHPVYVSLNRPLTIGGADRRLFFLALVMGGATFTFFGRLLAGILMFVALYVAARWMAQTDPQLLRIILRAASARARYDAGTLEYLTVRQGARR
jgi:type IV secretory pathway TrbD component